MNGCRHGLYIVSGGEGCRRGFSAYDSSARLSTRTWARTLPGGGPLVTTYAYNLQDELTGITYTDDTPPVSYVHDANGNLRSVSDAAGSHSLGYNALNELTSETGLADGSWLQHTFDGYGRPTGYILHDPQSPTTVSYGYDPNTGQLLNVASGAISATYGYDPASGVLLTTTTGSLRTTRTPDSQGRLQSIATTNTAAGNATLVSVTYGYDGQNRRTTATREDNGYWSYGYNGRSEVTSGVKYYSDKTPIPGMSYGYAYDPIGNRTSTTINAATANYTPTALNQYTQRDVPPRAEVVAQVSSSNPSSVTAAVNGVGVSFEPSSTTPSTASATAGDGSVTSVELDQHGTLYGTISVNNTASPTWQSTRVLALSNTTSPQSVDTTNGYQYVAKSPEQFAYDNDGNLTLDGRWSYTWDAENRLTKIQATAGAVTAGAPNSTIAFTYDAKGRRMAKVVKTYDSTGVTLLAAYQRQFAYDDWNLIEEYETNPANLVGLIPLRGYTWGRDLSGTIQGAGGVGGLLGVAELLSDGTTVSGNYATLFDGNGNILEVVALGSTATTGNSEYGPFGEAVRSWGPAGALPFRFSTKYEDEEWKGIGFGQRYYNASLGRWIAGDPVGESGGIDLYGYVNNNPVSLSDYLGRNINANRPGSVWYPVFPLDSVYWDTGVAVFATYSFNLARVAMLHDDGTLPGDWTLNGSEVNEVRGLSEYKQFVKIDLSEQLRFYFLWQNPGLYPWSSRQSNVGFKYGTDAYYAFGHARFDSKGSVILCQGRATYYATVKLSDDFSFLGYPGVNIMSPTAAGFRLETHNYLVEFRTKGEWKETIQVDLGGL